MQEKQCSRCLENKNVNEFHKQSRVSSGYQSVCKSCRKYLDAELYKKNKKRRKGRVKEIRLERGKWAAELKNKPCTDCGVIYPHYVMQWDHLPGHKKEFEIAELTARAYAKERVLQEIAKCELVCANCHATRTYKRRCHYSPVEEAADLKSAKRRFESD